MRGDGGATNMIAVIFEAQPHAHQLGAYLDAAARLRPLLERFDGFISVERFESLSTPGKILSLSWWRDAEAVARWRNVEAHRRVQHAGRESIFADYRLHVAQVVRAYGMNDRNEAPEDSRAVHDIGSAAKDRR
jgi:heme-degrading monooxygenase HmoA